MPESDRSAVAEIQFEVRVTHEHARLALKRFFFGLLGGGWLFWLAIVLCAGSIAFDLWDGTLDWLSIALISVLSVLMLLVLAAYIQRRRRVSSLIDQFGGQAISYRISEDELSASSPLGSSVLKWPAIQELWIDDDLALLFYARGAYTTLPIEQIPNEAIDRLMERISFHGGKIVDSRK